MTALLDHECVTKGSNGVSPYEVLRKPPTDSDFSQATPAHWRHSEGIIGYVSSTDQPHIAPQAEGHEATYQPQFSVHLHRFEWLVRSNMETELKNILKRTEIK
jgi:hypothetical protein